MKQRTVDALSLYTFSSLGRVLLGNKNNAEAGREAQKKD